MSETTAARPPIFVDKDLARRLEMAEAEGGASCGYALARERPQSGAAVKAIAGGRAVFTGIGSPISQATAVGLNGPVSPEEFDRLQRFYFDRKSAVNIETSPHADATLFAHYAHFGYCATEFSSVLVRRTNALGGELSTTTAVTVEEIASSQKDLWVRTVCTGFAEHHPVTDELMEVMGLFGSTTGATMFLAKVDGVVAGGAAVFVRDGISGLFGASTLVEFRRRGVQRELIRVRLEKAARANCEIALTFTQPGSISERNMLRNGFTVAYTRTKFSREFPMK